MTINLDSAGVGFGSVDTQKPTETIPYVANANTQRLHCIGDNSVGYPITAGHSYKISITNAVGTTSVGITSFNEDGLAQLESTLAITNTNYADSGWKSLTVENPYTFTPPSINGKDTVCIWLVFSTSNHMSTSNTVCPITIEEL